MAKGGQWLKELQCRILSMTYDYERHEATLVLPPDNCTDMDGTIAMIRRIDPAVLRIITIAGSVTDTQYLYDVRTGKWKAGLPR
jgi:hypothetical protein